MEQTIQKMWKLLFIPVAMVLLSVGFSMSHEFVSIAAGVSIFLLGMLFLEDGFRNLAGGALDKMLRYSTDSLSKSILFGVVSTTLVQSSTLVSVLTISFLSAGLIGLSSGIGVILGANLGTTTGAWLIAGFGLKLSLSSFVQPVLVFGALFIFQAPKSWKGAGYILVGISFFFMGIDLMKEGFDAFKNGIDLSQYAMEGFLGLVVYVIAGIVITAAMQSSHATLVLILTALSLEQLSYQNALALAIGSNIGTTITAMLSAINARVEGKRLAGAHFLFNFFTGAVAIVFIQPLGQLVDWVAQLLQIAQDDYTLKLAIFHSLFNFVGICLTIPTMKQLEKILLNLIPDRPAHITRPVYLDESSREYPKTAIESARKESIRLYDISIGIVCHGIGVRRRDIFDKSKSEQEVVGELRVVSEDLNEKYLLHVKSLYSEIVKYISIASGNANSEDAERLHDIRLAGNFLAEAIKAVQQLQKNLFTFIESGDEVIISQYNNLRGMFVTVLREIDAIRTKIQKEEDFDAHDLMISLDEMKVYIAKNDLRNNDGLNVLLRDSVIEPEIATSLINDSGHAYNACKKILQAARILFVEHTASSKQVSQTIELDEDDVSQLVKGSED